VEHSLGLIDGSTKGASREWIFYSGFISLMTKDALDKNNPVDVLGDEFDNVQ
jgi:hypothetical protein